MFKQDFVFDKKVKEQYEKGQILYEKNTKYSRICFTYFNSIFDNNIYFNVLYRSKSNEYNCFYNCYIYPNNAL